VKAARSNRRAIRIVSQCATAEEFVAAFHPYLDRDALFIATGSPEETGQAVRFVLTLAGGETVLRGAGRVVETHRDRGNVYGLRGMKLQFDELDDGSRRALGALESRAGPRTRGAPAPSAPASPDVIECLIYDDPETEASDPAAANASRRRGARPAAERGLPLGDDDVTAVSQAPPRSPRSSGTGPQPHQGAAQRATGAVPAPTPVQNTPLPPPGVPPAHPGTVPPGMSFIVPRPRPDGDGSGEVASEGPPAAVSGAIEMAEIPTDMMPAMRPRPTVPPMAMPQSGPVRMAHTPAHGLPSGSVPPHMMPPEPFTPPEFGMPPTRTGVRRGIPRPPMPAERTELVRFHRPSYVRTAAVSATLGALLGLGAGYLLWGMDHALRGSRMAPPADKTENAAPDEAGKPEKADKAAPIDKAGPAAKDAPEGNASVADERPTPGDSETGPDQTAAQPASAADAGAAQAPPPPRPGATKAVRARRGNQ
jgi:hypothetical protein